MRDFFRSSFRNRIFSMMLVAVMLIVVFSNVILLNIYIENSNKRIEQQNEQRIDRMQQAVEEVFQSFESIADEMEKSMLTKIVLRAEKNSRILYQRLFECTQKWNDVAQFHIFTKDGICAYTTNSQKFNQTMDLSWGPLYLAAQSNEMVVMAKNEMGDLQNNENGLVCAYAIRDSKETILGYFVITMTKSDFDLLFQDLYDSDFGSLYLLDSYWRIVYAPNSAQAQPTVSNLRTQFLRGESLSGVDDKNRYYVFHAEDIGFYFVLEQSNLYSNSVLEANQLVMYQMCIIALPVCLLFAWLLSRHFSKPVSQLDHAMKEIEGGNYDVKLEIRSEDEFERLALGFNKMASQYKQNLLNQQELNKAQMRMLQAQLNPHFLYNTLDAIKWLGVTHNVPVIAKLTTSLAAILRSSISSKALVMLDDELDFLEHYISIQCRDPRRVPCNHGICGIDDNLGRTVVLFQTKDIMLRIILLEVKDILDLGASECIDGLRVITHDAEVTMELTQLLKYQILSDIRILILIDHDIVETARNRLEGGRIVAQKYVHVQQDVIEIHDSRLPALFRIPLVDVAYPRLLRRSVILKRIRVAAIGLCRYEIVLRHRYPRKHILRLIYLIVELKLLQACLYGTYRIACIIYREGLGIPQRSGELAEESDEHRMEGSHIQSPGLPLTHHERNPFLHLGSRLLGKGQSQDS